MAGTPAVEVEATRMRVIETVLRSALTIAGVLGLLVFFYTGSFMRSRFPGAYAQHDAIRYLYRANHLYVMFSSVLNLAVGRSLRLASARWRRALQAGGSIALVVATAVLVGAFFSEPPQGGAERGATLLGCVLALGGSLAHGLASERR